MLGDFENESEIDLEDLEARLYGQIYHSTSEDMNTEPKNISNYLSDMQRNSKRKASRYFEHVNVDKVPQAYQPSRFVDLRQRSSSSHDQNITGRTLSQPAFGSNNNGLERNSYNVYQNNPYNEPNNCSQPNPYANGYQQFMLPGPPAINNILVIPPSPTQIFPSSYHRSYSKKAKKLANRQRRRERLREQQEQREQQSSSTQTTFRPHRMQLRPRKSGCSATDEQSDSYTSSLNKDDIVILSDSNDSDVEEIIQNNPVIDLCLDDDDKKDEARTKLSQNSSIHYSDSNTSMMKDCSDILKNQNISLENKTNNPESAIIKKEPLEKDDSEVAKDSLKTISNTSSESVCKSDSKEVATSAESEDDVIIIEPNVTEQEIINIDDVKDSDSSILTVDDITSEPQKDLINDHLLNSKQSALLNSDSNSEVILVEVSVTPEEENENGKNTLTRREYEVTSTDATNDFLDSVELKQTNFNFELHGNDFCYSKSSIPDKNAINSEAYETESSCSTIDIPQTTNVFDEIALDIPSREAFDEPNLESFADFITPKRNNSGTSATSRKTQKSGREDNNEEDSKYLQIDKSTKQKSDKKSSLIESSPISSDSEMKVSLVGKKCKRKKKKTNTTDDSLLPVDVESIDEQLSESKTPKRKKKKKNKNIHNVEVCSINAKEEEDNALAFEESLGSSTPKSKKKKKRKKGKELEEHLADAESELVDTTLESENTTIQNTVVDNTIEALDTSNYTCDKPKRKKKHKKPNTSLDETAVEMIEENIDFTGEDVTSNADAPENSEATEEKMLEIEEEINVDEVSVDEELNVEEEVNVEEEINVEEVKETNDTDKPGTSKSSNEMTWRNIEIIDESTSHSIDELNVEDITDENIDASVALANNSNSECSLYTIDHLSDDSNSELSFCTVADPIDDDSVMKISDGSSSGDDDDLFNFDDTEDDIDIVNVESCSDKFSNHTTQESNSKQFSYYWSNDMKKFYSHSWGHENFSIFEIQKTMSDNPDMWKIIESDKYLQMIDSKGPRCRRCRQIGHMAHRCPNKPNVPVCTLCGGKGHLEPRCPNKLCTSCGQQIDYSTTYCSSCKGFRHVVCNICRMRGHPTSKCPDLWRRYHLTTEEGPIVSPEKNDLKPPHKRWCSGCGSQGHFEYDCRYYNRTHSATLLAVQSYTPVYAPLNSPPKRKQNSHEEDATAAKRKHPGSSNDRRDCKEQEETAGSSRPPNTQNNQNQYGQQSDYPHFDNEDLRNKITKMKQQSIVHSEAIRYAVNVQSSCQEFRNLPSTSADNWRNNLAGNLIQDGRFIQRPKHQHYFLNPWALRNMFSNVFPAVVNDPQAFAGFFQNTHTLQSNPMSFLPPQNFSIALQENFQNVLNSNSNLFPCQQPQRPLFAQPQPSSNFYNSAESYQQSKSKSSAGEPSEERRSENHTYQPYQQNRPKNHSYQPSYQQDRPKDVDFSKDVAMPDHDVSNVAEGNAGETTSEVRDTPRDNNSEKSIVMPFVRLSEDEFRAMTTPNGSELLNNLSRNIGTKFVFAKNKNLGTIGTVSSKALKIIDDRVHAFLHLYFEGKGLLPLPKTQYYIHRALKRNFSELYGPPNLVNNYRSLCHFFTKEKQTAHDELTIKRKLISINSWFFGTFQLKDVLRHLLILENWLLANGAKIGKCKLGKVSESEWEKLNTSYRIIFQNDSTDFFSLKFLRGLPTKIAPSHLIDNIATELEKSQKQRNGTEINFFTQDSNMRKPVETLLVHIQKVGKKRRRRKLLSRN